MNDDNMLLLSGPFTQQEVSVLSDNGAEIFERKGISGHEPFIDALFNIAAISLPLISGLLLAKIKSKEKIRIKYKKLDISGVSENSLVAILAAIEKDLSSQSTKGQEQE